MSTENKNIESFEEVVAQLSSSYNCSTDNVRRLIEITGEMTKGARFASIKDYRSDKSDNSENADHSVILGFSYENMKKADKETMLNFDVNTVDIDKFNYDSINTGNLTLEEYKNEVKLALPKALVEINSVKTGTRVSNDIYLNKILVFILE